MALGSYINNRTFQKPEPFRDALLFIVICEGSKREIDYFEFFDKRSKKIKVKPIANPQNKSAPYHLISTASEIIEDYNEGDYELWFVFDVDDWTTENLNEVIRECRENQYWNFAISNPCFEVWLYLHFNHQLPEYTETYFTQCDPWKQLLDQSIEGGGGFDSQRHPTLIRDANQNARQNYQYDGHFPLIGSTQLYHLGEKLYELTRDVLDQHNP